MGNSAISGVKPSPDVLEAVKIGAVARVINSPALILQDEPAVTAMVIVQRARAPVLAGREGDLPIALRKTLPPFQLDDACEAEVLGQIADAPRHHADFRTRQAAQRRFVEMIEVRMRQQHQINPRQVPDFQAGTLDALQEEQPVRKIRVNQNVQVRKLD